VSSKQLTASADNLLSLQMDACLTLSSSVPSRLCSAASPASHLSFAAADAGSKPVRQKRRLSSKRTKRTRDCDCIERHLCLAAASVDSRHNSNSEALHHQLADVRDIELNSDADAGDISSVCSSDCSPPVSQQAMKLPRSGSNITRKKAFYNMKRPQSIVRRDRSSSTADDSVNVSS